MQGKESSSSSDIDGEEFFDAFETIEEL